MKESVFTALVKEKTHITPEIITIELAVSGNFTYEAGQFVNIIFDESKEDGFRSYSILSAPSKTAKTGTITLCMKLIHGGYASNILKKAEPGHILTIKGPYGKFVFNKNAKEHFFVCTGTGFVPFYAMIHEYLHARPNDRFTLLYGTKTQEDIAFRKEFETLERHYPNFTFIPTLTRETKHWAGKKGRVYEHFPENPSWYVSKTFYICGLKELIVDMTKLLRSRGVPNQQITFERYS